MKNQESNKTLRQLNSSKSKKEQVLKKENKTSFTFRKNEDIQINKEYIEQMKQENQTLKEELLVEARKSQNQDVNLAQKMESIQEESAIYAKKIEIESKKMKDLELLIEQAETQLYESRKKLNASDGVELPHLMKKQKNLEGQLDQIKQKHNESLAEINMMKEQINIARRERVIFSNVFKKLESDIRQKEDEFKKSLLIRKQVETELKEHEEEFHQMKICARKAEKSLLQSQKDYENAFKNQEKKEDKILNENDFRSNIIENELKSIDNSITTPKNFITKASMNPNTNTMQKAIDEVQHYEFMFEKLAKETTFQDIEELIVLFKNIEDINSDLFRKVNKLNDDIDDYERQIIEVRAEIKKYTKGKGEGVNDKDTDTLKLDYELQLEKNRDLDEQIDSVKSEILKFSEELLKIADKIGLEPRLFLTDGEVNEWNTQVLIQKVEERSNELIDLCKFFDNQVVDVETQKYHDEKEKSVTNDSKVENRSDLQMIDLLDNMEKEKESEKIMSIRDFKDQCQKELGTFKKKGSVRPKNKKDTFI